MILTVQLAHLGPVGTVRSLIRRPTFAEVPGLRSAEVALLAPLVATGPPSIGTAGLIAFWDHEDAADDFIDTHPTGQRFSGGLRACLRPLRAYGSLPGLPDDVPDARAVPHDGPVVVVTLARLHLSQTIRFARASRPAEKAAVAHDGMIWGTAAIRVPFLATISIWQSSRAAATYAYGRNQAAHRAAIAKQHEREFHRQSAFIRFAPTRVEGALGGSNPLDASAISL
ncbi:hypothetical protein BH20ACT3_BH20ACT3_01530 [soil metagenome]